MGNRKSGRAGARVITVTRDDLVRQWQELFAQHPGLDGLGARGSCEDVFCCPDDDGTLDWLALSQASELLFLAGWPSGGRRTLSRDMLSQESHG